MSFDFRTFTDIRWKVCLCDKKGCPVCGKYIGRNFEFVYFSLKLLHRTVLDYDYRDCVRVGDHDVNK